jgi:EAL domain-containing protein (putative c-di-GMP-specific phosphodiesterase class I)
LPAPNIQPVPPRTARQRSARHDAAERRLLTRRLRQALATGDLLLHYQPLVALNSERVRGTEALVRLRHHRLGLLAPSDFMPGADQAGIIHEIGGWLLDQACADAAAWPDSACVAVTLAPRQVQSRKFIRHFLERLGRTGIAPERLECTLTETMLTDPSVNMEFSLKALQGLGVRLALANFSAANANLPALRRLRLSTLRLDRSLTHSLNNGSASHAIVRDTIKAGHDLGCTVLADGVDTKRQFSKLVKLRCDEGQGNYFGQPLGAPQMTAQFTQS